MPLSKCLRCEKLFNKIDNPICTDCLPSEEDDFETIRNSVNENPGINAEGISELSGVDIKCVLRMIDRGSISTVPNITELSTVTCGQCGAPAISASKKLCQECLDKLNRKMMEVRQSIQIVAKKKMEVEGYSGVRDSLQKKRK